MPGTSAAGCLLGVIRMNRPARWAALVLALVAVAALAFWAGRVTLTPPAQAEQRPAASALVTVAEQELGRVITLGVSVSREQTPAAVNALTGVVTRAGESGEVAAGEVLYAVAQKPVLVLQGELPQWRPLGEGTSGDDVAAFQRMLAATGAKVEATGTWDEATADAWDDWLTERGYPAADTVELGQLVVLDALPAPLSVDAKTTAVGTTLAGGENVVARPGDQPDFALEVNQEQAALIPAGTQVTVPHGEHEWKAVAGESTSDEQGLIRITLTAPDGGVVCGEDCDTLPADATTSLLSQVSVVPPVSGPVVPVSALRTQPDGAATVTVVPGGVCARALPSRLRTTWCSRCSSPVTVSGSSGSESRHRWSGPNTRASATDSSSSRVTSTSTRSSGRPESSRASSSRSSTSADIRSVSVSTFSRAEPSATGSSGVRRDSSA